ncbi:hypothetical protein FOYG_16645 [Fusarium oxysporum NRRL 32931]|uniref:Fungal lipase-type domain-containing protein n=1 Tax=Fusarium oxysporum NRRL 32931 TaxID=660029 RepID=W9HEN3_FUSOX|nr:hypothetical protein FOYG_16645 [Fusarium oxysporum NRRL 32931]
MANDPPGITELRRQLAHESLERISQFEPPSQPDGFSASPCSIALKILKKWSSDNKQHIEKAVNAQAFGNNKDTIDWSIAFLPFMESTAVYLRDWRMFLQAWNTYRVYKSDPVSYAAKHEEAIELYAKAYEDIDELAHEWNMHYVNICDLVTESPEGHSDWDGPFCGAFLPNDKNTDKPFIGVAFKGTNPLQSREIQVDLNYQLIEASDELGNQLVSTGVYTGLFGKFEEPYGQPYQFIRTQLAGVTSFFARSNTPARLHVTGHSLGGSYSSLCYAGFLKDIPTLFPETEAIMGDQYTFGAPRVGSNDWAKYNLERVSKSAGQTWRIVNNDDIVPQVPPTTLKPDQINFFHVDKGMKIFKDQKPETIPSEIDGPEPPIYDIGSIGDFIKAVLQTKSHVPNSYYDAMVYAMGG